MAVSIILFQLCYLQTCIYTSVQVTYSWNNIYITVCACHQLMVFKSHLPLAAIQSGILCNTDNLTFKGKPLRRAQPPNNSRDKCPVPNSFVQRFYCVSTITVLHLPLIIFSGSDISSSQKCLRFQTSGIN